MTMTESSHNLNQESEANTGNNINSEHQRIVNTFMKRRTHMNKQAEQALTDLNFRKYLVNVHGNQPLINNIAEKIDINPKTHRLAKIKGISDDVTGITNLRELFSDAKNGSDAPLTLEIGFGMGDSLIEMAMSEPERNFIGIEVHEPGIGRCAYMAYENDLDNIKIINGDAIKLMKQLPENHIDRVQLYFPDPWQKKRHYKRRFVSPERMEIVTRVLKQGGWFHCATDWEHYSQWMLEVLDNFDGLSNSEGEGNFTPRPDFRPMTKFERRGIDRGHGIWDLIYIKD